MEILAAYDLSGSLRPTAELTGSSHHTVARHVAARDAVQSIAEPAYRGRVTDPFLPKIEAWIEASKGKIRADKAHDNFVALGYSGFERSTRRAIAQVRIADQFGRRGAAGGFLRGRSGFRGRSPSVLARAIRPRAPAHARRRYPRRNPSPNCDFSRFVLLGKRPKSQFVGRRTADGRRTAEGGRMAEGGRPSTAASASPRPVRRRATAEAGAPNTLAQAQRNEAQAATRRRRTSSLTITSANAATRIPT